MITNTWRRAFKANFGGSNSDYKSLDFQGATRELYCSSSYIASHFPALSIDKVISTATPTIDGVIFGTGTTPPSADDHKLSGDVVTQISFQSSAQAVQISEDKNTFTNTYLLKNTGTTDITINEVGWIGKRGSYYFLFDRTLLSSPVTIPAGEVGAVAYSIAIELPSA